MINGPAKIITKIIWLLLIFTSGVFSYNQPVFVDSLSSDTLFQHANSDSLLADSVQTDSTLESKKKGVELDGPIIYSASIVSVSRTGNKIYLQGDAKVVYQSLKLDAEKIMIDQDNKTMFAEGVLDTVDSEGNPIYSGTPVFSD